MKDSKKMNYWFKRRRYGWGWVPVTWQGFLVIIGSLTIILVATFQLPPKPSQPSAVQLVTFFIITGVTIVILFCIAYLKSPKPHWRWGKQPGDNPEEDF